MNDARFVPVAVVVGLVVLLGVGAWLLARTPGSLVNETPPRLGATPSSSDAIVTITVERGESAREIGEKLEEAGVIESARLFRVLTDLMGLGDELEAGIYEFQPGETALIAVRRISEGITASRGVTIREGLRLEEIADVLEEEGIVSADAFLLALEDEYNASFLEQLPPDAGLEGFLFPATYRFSLTVSAREVVQRLLGAFDQRYREEIEPRLRPDGLSLHEIVVLASIIEREAQVAEERPVIASVFVNRLARGIALQADPTVQYALGNDPASVEQYGYWKRELSNADLASPSPYNTYAHPGLPPGPIANPGLASILAALEPADTNYLYFVARPGGCHAFAETLEEHNRNVRETNPPEC